MTREEKIKQARNRNTPIDVLISLSVDKDSDVRRGVSRNQNTSIDILEKLALDEDEYVRGDVAKNTNTPIVGLKKLEEDRDTYVRLEATLSLERIKLRLVADAKERNAEKRGSVDASDKNICMKQK